MRRPFVPMTRKRLSTTAFGSSGPAHRVSARGVVPPGVVLHELDDLLVRRHRRPGDRLLLDGGVRSARSSADELDAVRHRLEIFACRVVAFVEVVELMSGASSGLAERSRT